MISNDRQEKERIDARNALEEFVYEVRGKMQEGGNLYDYIEEAARQQVCTQLEDLEVWLYEEGETCERELYKTKLTELHNQTDPIKYRYDEYEGQSQAFNDLGHAIQMSLKAVEQFRRGDAKYDHLTETEILNISEQTEKTQKWFEDARNKVSTVKKTQDPPIKITDIRHEFNTLSTCVNSVLNRPKPKPASPPPTAKPTETATESKTEPNEKMSPEVEMDVE